MAQFTTPPPLGKKSLCLKHRLAIRKFSDFIDFPFAQLTIQFLVHNLSGPLCKKPTICSRMNPY